LSTKIHALVDALGNPRRFLLTPGQVHDLVGADALLPQMAADVLIADKAFDADDRVIQPLAAAGKSAVIPPRRSRLTPRDFDQEPLQSATPGRKFLRQTQAVLRHRHPLRQNRQKFPGRGPSRRRYNLAQLTTRPSPGPRDRMARRRPIG
jgi:transposase